MFNNPSYFLELNSLFTQIFCNSSLCKFSFLLKLQTFLACLLTTWIICSALKWSSNYFFFPAFFFFYSAGNLRRGSCEHELPFLQVFFSKIAWRYATAVTFKHNLKSIFTEGERSSKGGKQNNTNYANIIDGTVLQWGAKMHWDVVLSLELERVSPGSATWACINPTALPIPFLWLRALNCIRKHPSIREWRTTQQQNYA